MPDIDVTTGRIGELPDVRPAAVPGEPMRDRHGRFLNGNRAAVSHAIHAADLPAEFQHLQREVDAFLAGAVADDGGDTEITTRRRSLLEYRGRLHRRIIQLDSALELRGLVDRRNKLRVTWLAQLSTLIASAVRLDSLLGLDRRTRQLPSLAQLLTQHQPTAIDASTPVVASPTESR